MNTVGIKAISSCIELVWLGPPCPLNCIFKVLDDVSSDRYYMHNKGIFSHVIILPCQPGCHEDCIFVETSLAALQEKSFAGGRTFIMSKSGNGHLQLIIHFSDHFTV
jgi:hypothetical protein